MALMTEDQIAERVTAMRAYQNEQQDALAAAEQQQTKFFQYVRPLAESADSVIDSIENTEDRFMFGLEPIDFRTRGVGGKELLLLTGFAHAGKTQLINTAILNNRDKRILFFSMDDPAEMILLKLVCMLENVDAETLERQIRRGDEAAKLKIRQAATQVFDHLSVVDDSIGLDAMDVAIEEFTRLHSGPPQCVVIDYVGSMQHGSEDESGAIKQKMAAIKRWVKDKEFPTIVAHQNTRSNGGPGAPITMLSGGYGGEAEATFVVGVRRKRDWEELEPSMRQHHQDTVTLHLVKNKRPPGKKTPPEGVDFFMDQATGLIRVLRDGDMGGLRTHDQAMAARRDID